MIEKADTSRRLLTARVEHAESPRWHDGRLWFSDVYGSKLHTMDLDGDMFTVAESSQHPSGIGFMPDGRCLLLTSLDKKLHWVMDGRLEEACDLSGLAIGPTSDMVVDGMGRAYISDTGFDYAAGGERPMGQVLLFTEADGPRVVAGDIGYANGCAVSADGSRYYVAESFGECVSVFDIEDDGSLSGRRPLVDFGTLTDGLCLDAEEHAWVALPTERRYVRVDPGGQIVDQIASTGALATACVLGGPDGRTLFMCSVNATIEELSHGISEGMIEAVEVEVPGAGWP